MWITIFWATAALVVVVALGFGAALGRVALRSPGIVAALYRRHFREPRRERQFLASVGFFVTFFAVRLVTHAIRAGVGPWHDVAVGGTHVHHLVWGILLLLGVGYCWLVQIGTGVEGDRRASRLTALLFGLGAALTLDEFALWLRLQDVYWSREGRESVEAVFLFGAILSVGLWGRPFFAAILREAGRALRRP